MYNEIIYSSMADISARISLHEHDTENTPHQHCENHFHDELEFLYVRSGKFLCVSGDIRYTAEKGDIIFINNRIPHYTFSLVDNTHIDMLQFDLSDFSGDRKISATLSRFININKESVIIFKSGDEKTQELTEITDNIFAEFAQKKFSYELYIKAEIFKIIAFLSRNDILTDSSVFFDEKLTKKIMPALEYIDTHFSEQISLDELSSLLNLDPSYFCRLFKKSTNSTFTEYLNFVRVCKSEKRLSLSDESISEIAYSLGFSSVSYFNKIFRRYKGCTPTEYKKSKYSLQ